MAARVPTKKRQG